MPLYLDYYNTLGITSDATSEEIALAYTRLKLLYETGIFAEGSPERLAQQNAIRQIDEAYDILHDEISRYMYDQNLSCCIRMGEIFEPFVSWNLRFMDACIGTLIASHLSNKNPSLEALVLLSVFARNIYKNVRLRNSEDTLFFSLLISPVSLIDGLENAIRHRSAKLILTTPLYYLSQTPAGKTWQALRNTTRDDIQNAPRNLFQYAKSTTIDVASSTANAVSSKLNSTKNFLTQTVPDKWNSLQPSVQSIIHYFALGICFLNFVEKNEASQNNACFVALCLSGVDYGIRKVSSNTYGLFSGIAHGAYLAGKTAVNAAVESAEAATNDLFQHDDDEEENEYFLRV